MTLPANPSYELACQMIDNDDLTPWQAVLEQLSQKHQIELKTINKISGWANGLFIINDQWVIKIVPPNWHSQGKREREALQLVNGYSLPLATPTLQAHGEINGWIYIIMDKLPGTNIHSVWDSLSQSNQCQIVEQIAHFSTALHQIPLPAEAWQTELYQDWNTFLSEQKANCYEKYKERNINAALKASINPFLERTSYLPTEQDCRLIHTDLHGGNILGRSINGTWQLTGVIDFGDAFISPDVYFEYATSSALLGLGNKTVNHALLKAYQLDIDINNLEQKKRFQQHLTALMLLRHMGGVDYVLERVPGSSELTDWEQVSEVFFAL